MTGLLILSPTLIALFLMVGSIAINKVVNFEYVKQLVISVQLFFLVAGVVKILTSRGSGKSMPKWRQAANKWVGRIMAMICIFYLVAFIFIAEQAP